MIFTGVAACRVKAQLNLSACLSAIALFGNRFVGFIP